VAWVLLIVWAVKQERESRAGHDELEREPVAA
jgi:hypothetical protein